MGREILEMDELLKSINMLTLSVDGIEAGRQPGDYTGYSREELENRGFWEAQIEEIENGIKQHLPVWHYARNCYNWKQMKEIRMGLLENIDISLYDNYLFEDSQMREIRMGLIDHLDVSSYANLILSARDMGIARKNLLSEAYASNPSGYGRDILDEKTGIRIRISDNCMLVYLKMPEKGKFTVAELENLLHHYNVLSGISRSQLKKAAAGDFAGKDFLAAKGTLAKPGTDGRYEYFFNPLLPGEPTENGDGSVDYTQVIVADKREAGDVLAKYYPAEKGSDGETVTGILIPGGRGRELPILRGQGFIRDAEKNLYTATASGYVILDEDAASLNVWNVYVVNGNINRYNGNITYDGIIHIRGSVSDMARVEATGNVIVDGYVEAAHIKAGENIILKSGMNGCGKGVLEAGGRVAGKFFEEATIYARGNVEGNYFLNCKVVTDKSLIAKGTKSRIMGGSIKAGYFVESYTVMDAGRGTTVIDVGDMAWINGHLKEAEEHLGKTESELLLLNEGKEKLDGMLDEKAEKQNALFHKICIAIGMKEEELQMLLQEKLYYEQMERRARKAYIQIYSRVQAGVVLTVGGKTRKISEDLRGKTTFRKERA